jgi:hypothetical protein
MAEKGTELWVCAPAAAQAIQEIENLASESVGIQLRPPHNYC